MSHSHPMHGKISRTPQSFLKPNPMQDKCSGVLAPRNNVRILPNRNVLFLVKSLFCIKRGVANRNEQTDESGRGKADTDIAVVAGMAAQPADRHHSPSGAAIAQTLPGRRSGLVVTSAQATQGEQSHPLDEHTHCYHESVGLEES